MAAALHALSWQVEQRDWSTFPRCENLAEGSPTTPAEWVPDLEAPLLKADGRPRRPKVVHEFVPLRLEHRVRSATVEAREELSVVAAGGWTASVFRPCRIEFALRTAHAGVEHIAYTGAPHGPVMFPASYRGIRRVHEAARIAIRLGNRFLLRDALAELDCCLVSRRMTVCLETARVRARAAEILQWATVQAVARWNDVLAEISHLEIDDGADPPSLLIRGEAGAIGGYAAGQYQPTWSGRMQGFAGTGIILVGAVEGRHPEALIRSPEDVRHIVEHEIGHAYGLDDCVHLAHYMGARLGARLEDRPGRPERRAICRRLELTVRYRKQIRVLLNWGPVERTLYDLPRDGAFRFFSRPPDSTPPPRFTEEVEPDWMECIWAGDRRLSAGDTDGAVAQFRSSLSRAPSPAEAAWRLGSALSDQPERAEEANRWLTVAIRHARPWWTYQWAWIHRALACSAAAQGDADLARWHALRSDLCTARMELSYAADVPEGWRGSTFAFYPRWICAGARYAGVLLACLLHRLRMFARGLTSGLGAISADTGFKAAAAERSFHSPGP